MIYLVYGKYNTDFKLISQKEKTNKFSLNEDEDDLTHFGQSLSSIEKFEEPLVSEDEVDGGRIDDLSNYVIY